jgi:hypothetical protein
MESSIDMTQQMKHEHEWAVISHHHWQCGTCGKTFG